MLKSILHFIKYNNAVILILALVFILGSGAFAQTELGQEFIGIKETRIEGIDNTLLLEADLDNFQMDFTIEGIEEDEQYFYVKYTMIDLVEEKDVWVYQMSEKIRKISKKFRGDMGEYMAQELQEEYNARIKFLKKAQITAQGEGEAVRTEITEYSGLIGKTLDTVAKIFPAYEPVKKRNLILPEQTLALASKTDAEEQADDLASVYDEYVNRMDPDNDGFLGVLDNCPDVANPDQLDEDEDGLGDACDKYFTLKPVIEDEQTLRDEEELDSSASSTDETASSTHETQPAEENAGDGSESPLPIEEPDVEIVELPAADGANASGTESIL